jgi:outer membrane protein assembly factor BamA
LVRLLRAAFTVFALTVATLVGVARAAPPASPTPPGGQETKGAAALRAGEDAALGATVPDLGEAPAQDLVGKPVRRVEVITIGDRWAGPLAVTAVRPGDPATGEAARRLMREALATGRFARANVEAYAESGGVVLRLNVLPRRLVATIQLDGGALDRGETLEAADVAAGGEVTAPRLTEIASRIRHFYEVHGFSSAQVRVDATDTDKPENVVLKIEIEPGKPRTISQRVFVIDPVLDREVGDLKSAYKQNRGARVDEPALGEADRDLAETLRQQGFFRAEVRHALRHVGPYSYLYVYVLSGPRLVPAFDGNRAFDAAELADALNIKKAPDARPGELIERLRAFYVSRGFLDVEVSMTEKGKPEDPVHYLAFTLREHRQVRVTKRVFPCLTGDMTPDDIGREIGSFLEEELPGSETLNPVDAREIAKMLGPSGPIGGRGGPADLNPLVTYAPDTYERALKHVKDLLHSKGYLNALVGPVSVLRATCAKRSLDGQCLPEEPKTKLEARCLRDSLGLPVPEPAVPEAFTCRPDPARSIECSPDLTLRIPIALGPQTTLYDIAFEGNRTVASDKLAKTAGLALGSPLSGVELEAARVKVLDEYRKEGYAYAEVVTNVEPSPDRTRARVRFYVTERDRVTVTGFVVKGAVRTNETLVLRRVALKKGGYFRADLARQTEERIATLGTFSSVSVSLEDAEIPERRKRVVITVIEQKSSYLDTTGGFSTGDGARFAVEWGHRNVGGLAISVLLRIQLSYLFDFLILDPTVRANYDKLSAADRLERRDTLSLNFPEIGLGPLVSLSLDAIDMRDNQRDYAITKEAIVPTLTYRPIRPLTTQLGFSTEYNDVSILNEKALAQTYYLLRAPEGRTFAFAQRLSFTSDFRDNPFDAKRGVLFSTGLEHVNAFPLGTEQNRATIKSHFLRFTGRFAGYIRLTQKGMVLALSVSAGFNYQLFGAEFKPGSTPSSPVTVVPGSKTYPDRLFFLGGKDSLRAFAVDSVVPQDVAEQIEKGKTKLEDVALRGGDFVINPRAELRVPITDLFQTALFLDTGNVWVDPAQINPAQLRYAIGTGLRISTPLGPVAFDYGINLNRRAWEDFGAFNFSIGLF